MKHFTPTDMKEPSIIVEILECHSHFVQKSENKVNEKIRCLRFVTTSGIWVSFCYPSSLNFLCTFFFRFHFAYTSNTNNVSYYCVRKWENQLKRLFLCRTPFVKQTWIYDQFPSGYLLKWTGKETSTTDEGRIKQENNLNFQFEPIISKNHWLHSFVCFLSFFSSPIFHLWFIW